MKKLLSLMALFVISLLAVSMVSADLNSTLGGIGYDNDVTVEVNGEELLVGNLLTVEKGETLDIEVELMNDGVEDAKDIEVVARLTGYEYSDYVELEDSTHLFDVKAGTRKTVSLEVTVPSDLSTDDDDEGLYTLRVAVLDRNGFPLYFEYELNVEAPRHALAIEDVDFSPGLTVKAGRSLLANVLVENYGDRAEEDVKVTVAIPSLGISATEYVDELGINNDNEDVSEDLFLSIPATTAEGNYEVEVTVEYDNKHESVTKTYNLHVLADERYNPETLVLAVGPNPQNANAGSTVTYGIALTNAGVGSEAYVLEASAGWATTSLSAPIVVLESGENVVVYLDVTANANVAVGENFVSLVVKSGEGNVLDTVVLTANVVSSEEASTSADFNLRNGLEIALIILVVLLVVIGLIVGFSRLRKDDDDEAYY